MNIIDKFFAQLSRILNNLVSKNYKLEHRYQNRNQITNAEFVLNTLKNKHFNPVNIIDIGCGHGEWTKKLIKFYPKSQYLLFDADKKNTKKLDYFKKKSLNITYKICLLSNDNNSYKFYNMGYGSSIYKEQTSNKGEAEEVIATTLKKELPSSISKYNNNLIKLDVQGSELKVLDGLADMIKYFEVIIIEVSLHNYNKNSPLFPDVINYMSNKNFRLYDLFDLKRLGKNGSFLVQFDCIFVRNNSDLLNVKF
tara:strand:+ start:643 stop:1398 length:756 start_codon:yes stop_codon:yes gene_type:complete